MKTRTSSARILTMLIAVGVLAGIYAVWGASPARAIIIVGGKTGMFTLTQSEAARLHIVNTEEHGIIIVGGKVADSEGNTLAEFPRRTLALGQATSFEFKPALTARERLAVRVELMVEEGIRGNKVSFIPTLEVFDTATGKTSAGQDFIIIVGG